jgi:hypothetical protein
MKLLNNLSKEDKKLALILGGTALTIGVLLFIFRKQIFAGMSAFKDKLTKLTESHWKAWDKGAIKEGDSRTMDKLRDYWSAVGWANRSDKDKINEAWSAAFISHMMKTAGAGDFFPYSASHSKYITKSIKNRKNKTGKFQGFKPNEVKVEIGDLIGRPRQSGITYDTTGSYKSHTDIVTDIKDGKAKMIGGNVGNSVSATYVKLDKTGKVDQSEIDKRNYHVVIKNLM